ncbi:hypothetical protein G4177_13965 [Corallococcus sp. ZKHCc1 1396]|uniref:Lipoprotein n=1 Tax=Corallococcus soli TaxID=2710757 RepID=A0ABR9PMW5_9BACT|nr:hypothetical protein [Corallococcus soli]MBE4749268.1 hypothetical protein [Corallococcus soli]
MSACATTRGQADGPAASLDVRVLNIVDEHGQTRIRLGAPLPDPQGMKRKYKVHGLQLMTASGQEVGGMGVIDETNSQALCFDTKAGYESLCLGVFNEQPSLYLMVKGKDRISLSVDQDVAKVVVSDAEEKPRVRVTVDKDGKTHVEGVTAPPENR